MARYIDADLLLEEVENNTPLNWTDSERELQEQFDFQVFKHIIEYQPTVDVVPKSEVEKWFRECEVLQGRLIELEKEVAREIFEEINNIREQTTGGDIMRLSFFKRLAELEKKCTESVD